MAEIKFLNILQNPHFSQFVALISVPFRSMWWRKNHPKVPFWVLLENCTRLINDVAFASPSTHTAFIGAFTALITTLVEADQKLYYRQEDMDWFAQVMSSDRAVVTMSMLFAMASARPNYLTPVQVAEANDTSESLWRNRCAAGEVIGAIKAGKQWLIPKTSLQAYGLTVDMAGRSVDEDGEPIEEDIDEDE